MKLRVPTQSGFDHVMVPLACFVVFALIGSFYLYHSLAATSVQWKGILEAYKTNSGYCLTTTGSSKASLIELDPCSKTYDSNQVWSLVDVRKTTISSETNVQEFYLQSANGGECIDDWGAAMKPSYPEKLYPCSTTDSAVTWMWGTKFTSRGYSSHQLASLAASNLCLDDKDGSDKSGTDVGLYTCKTSAQSNQEWIEEGAPGKVVTTGAVMGFDVAPIDFTASQLAAIKNEGYKLFVTNPIEWNSECSDGNCDAPVNTCTIDPAEVAQLQDAYNLGMDYAIYTRNVNCLPAAIKGLSSTLQTHLSFVVFDIETDPGVKLTSAMVSNAIALGQTPVVYSYDVAWESIMNNTTAYDKYPLWDSEVANSNVSFPAPLPSGFPTLHSMPYPYGGWPGTDPVIEQQQFNVELANDKNSSDAVDVDAVSASWLSSLPHQN